MKDDSLVSIIIVNWNGANVIDDCLKTLVATKYKEKELILIDNNSSDNSLELAEKYKKFFKKFIVIKNDKNVGFALANNQGVEKSKGEFILLLNNDTKVDPDFLTSLVRRLEVDKHIGVIQPKIYLMDRKGFLDNAGSYLTNIGFLKHWGFMKKDSEEFNQEKFIFSAKGACMLIRKSVIDKIGLFDADFHSYFEESDFCWRVWLVGSKILYYPKAVIYHKVGFTIKRLNVVELNYHYYKNRICSLIKNLEYKNFPTVLLIHLMISSCIMMLFLLKLQFNNALIVIKAVIWNLKNIKSTYHKRQFVQSIRKVRDDDLFCQLSRPVDLIGYWRDFARIEKDLNK